MSSIGPPTGMRDWLPQDALLRQRLMETISSVYRLYGYLPIDTPAMEYLAVLLGKGGGENEKLLFKILKRGEKLSATREASGELADYGLRFDLTVPLARFVATHQGQLPKVFRRYHIAPVWRADRPQKGRFREFYQCDIDAVGGAAFDYEVEIITATERVLKELNLGKYRFRVSDKRLLPLLLAGYGVPKEHLGSLAILLDKLDKISRNEILGEILRLLPAGSESLKNVTAFVEEAIDVRTHKTGEHARTVDFEKFWKRISDPELRSEIEKMLENLTGIMESVRAVNKSSAITFDPVLVRGLDYYTGPVYEAVMETADGFSSSVLGGGRYDDLIGTFAGKKIPAVGCSIGFERILAILQERKSGTAVTVTPQVLFVNEGATAVILQQQAEQLRNEGLCIETNLDTADVGRQFKYAEATGKRWAIRHFDVMTSSITVRDLSKRQDFTMPLSEFKTRLAGL